MEENKTEYETKLEEYAQLLDIRAGRIRVNSIIFDQKKTGCRKLQYRKIVAVVATLKC